MLKALRLLTDGLLLMSFFVLVDLTVGIATIPRWFLSLSWQDQILWLAILAAPFALALGFLALTRNKEKE